MSEFRQDIVTKEWVLIAPSRALRPNEFSHEPATPDSLPEVSAGCAFCPGAEGQTPPEISTVPSSGPWQVRVVQNKYSLLRLSEGEAVRDFYVALPGIGSHEVVITRPHDKPAALMPLSLIESYLSVYIDRLNEMRKHEQVRYVHIIQNHGKLGGASLVHPHSQIIAMPFLGPHIQAELRGAASHFNLFDRCIYCEIVSHERAAKTRVVAESEHFIVLCPYESKMPYQMRIMPKRHEADFSRITSEEKREFAAVLKMALFALYDKLENPSYNYYIHTLPFGRGANLMRSEESYHWHLVILPRINVWAGLELGTEIYVNTVPPEISAEVLKEGIVMPTS